MYRNRRLAPFTGLALVWTLVLTVPAGADEFHYNNVLIGDRASGMGGAYSAVSDDPSGLYYNPAGIVYGSGRNLSASVNAYHRTETRYRKVLGANDWVRSSSALLPNFFGFTQQLGAGTVGFSYAVTNSVQEDQDQTFTDVPGIESFRINFNNRDYTYKIGPSYGRQIAPGLALGLSLYLHYREQGTINNQLVTIAPGNQEWSNVYFQTEEYGQNPVLGLMWAPYDKLAVGASVRRTYVLGADSHLYRTCFGASGIPYGPADFCTPGEITDDKSEWDTRRRLPYQVRFGAAYFASRALLLAADLSYHSRVHDPAFDRTLNETWNAAAGLEYYLNPAWAVRSGLFTNNANTDSSGASHENIDLRGASASISRFTRSSSLTLGLNHARDSGLSPVIRGQAPSAAKASSTTVFLSTSYIY